MKNTQHTAAPASMPEAYFDTLYATDADPWACRMRWYERRKRSLLLASLPKAHYGRAFEPACGTGELTLELAARCGHLLASDFSPRALAIARPRLAALANVTLARHRLPAEWPEADGPFDLIVIGELGYYLDESALRNLVERCVRSLAPAGDLLACHWRPAFAERVLPTQVVHAAFDGHPAFARLARHEEQDFLLDAWSREPDSVASREGLT